jgi:hypothetical protein
MMSFYHKAARNAAILSLSALLVACGGGSSDATTKTSNGTNTPLVITPPIIPPVISSALVQYTPNQADWSTFTSKPIAARNTAHDPNSVWWISKATWDAAKWDGTIYNPTKMTQAAFTAAICPTGDTIRGIREVFYAAKPFADNAKPTKAEVDEWHRIAINHVRSLVGYTSADRQVKKDHCMFARAQWGDERKFTTKWDTAYPGTLDSAEGPCVRSGGVLSSNAHCGASFIPSDADQIPYLPPGHAPCTAGQGAEGVSPAPKSDIPWSIKWSRAFCGYVGVEGFWGGHTGPWFRREKFGLSFWDNDIGFNGSNATLRGKWTGNLMPVYCNPDPTKAEAGCIR